MKYWTLTLLALCASTATAKSGKQEGQCMRTRFGEREGYYCEVMPDGPGKGRLLHWCHEQKCTRAPGSGLGKCVWNWDVPENSPERVVCE